MDFLLRPCSGKGPHLAMSGEPRAFSPVAAGFSSYVGELREFSCCPREVQSPFELREGVRDSSRVAAGQIDLI